MVKTIGFELTSSDEGDYGMNTPAYFCFDDFGAAGTEVLPEKNIDVTPTAITNAAAEGNVPAVRKMMKNGRLVIINGDKQFTVDGAEAK
jgi:hypothetical protein